MTCEEIREDLSAYFDDELDADGRARVEEHLRECGACRKDLERLRALVELVAAVPAEEPPEGLRERISERVKREGRLWRLIPRVPWWLTSSAVAAALVGVVALVGALYVPYGRAPARAKRERAAPAVGAEAKTPQAAPPLEALQREAAMPASTPGHARFSAAKDEPSPFPPPPWPAKPAPVRKSLVGPPEDASAAPAERRRLAVRADRTPVEEAGAPDRAKQERALLLARAEKGEALAEADAKAGKRAKLRLGAAAAPRAEELNERGKAAGEERGARSTFGRTPAAPRPARREAEEPVALAGGPEEGARGRLREKKRLDGLGEPASAEEEEEEKAPVVELAAHSFGKALVLAEKAADAAGGKVETWDKEALEIVCLVPEAALGRFSDALPVSARRDALQKSAELRAEAVRAPELRDEMGLNLVKDKEAEEERLVRVTVRVQLPRR